MKKVRNEVKIGVTIVIAMLIAVIGFRLMQDMPLFRPSQQLYSVFDRVDGISPGSSVYLSGVKVGSVNRVSLAGPDSVVILMYLSYTDGIPVGSRAVIEPADLIGSKRVGIYFSDEKEYIPSGGFIKGTFDDGMFSELGDFADEIRPSFLRAGEGLADVIEHMDQIMREGGRQDINRTLESLRRSSGEIDRFLGNRTADLNQTVESLNRLVSNLDTLSSGRSPQLDSLMVNLEITSRELALITGELRGVSTELHQVLKSINQGEGTIGKLLHDPSLYENLDQLLESLREMTDRLHDEPAHFLKHMRLIDVF